MDEELEKLATAKPMQAAFVAGDFERVAAMLGDERTRPAGEALLKEWADCGEPLRKAMASAWLERAKAIVAPVISKPKASAKAAPGKKRFGFGKKGSAA